MPNESIKKIILRRTSVRSFDEKPLSEDLKKSIINYFQTRMVAPFGTIPRFKIISTEQYDNHQLGTYGFISGANDFIIGATQNTDQAIQDYGYQLEKIIIHATKQGLGTCWLGDTFNRNGFNQVIKLDENEFIPAITPIGYPSQERRLVGKAIRLFAGSMKRKEWSQLFFNNNFDSPLTKKEAGPYIDALEMVRLAPSGSNKQPWRIIKEKNLLHFYCETKNYSTIQKLDMGIAMSHLELTLNEENKSGKWINTVHPETEKQYILSWKLN
jgi:nitroreductase